MRDYSEYADKNINELIPSGKVFRILFDDVTMKFRLLTQNDILDSIIRAFSDDNPASFFVKQYGYNVESRVSPINKFGFFQIGMIFEILKYIKTHYGSLSCVAMSGECRKFIEDHLTPLSKWCSENDEFEFHASNISDDSGTNEKLKNEGKKEYKFRDYQENAIKYLLFSGKGRGLVELPTACHGKDHPILMYDGSIKKVQDIKVGDVVMGPDSKPRNVIETHSGIDDMYEISTSIYCHGYHSLSFKVNKNHIMSLVYSKYHDKVGFVGGYNGKITNISVIDYLNSKDDYTKHLKLRTALIKKHQNDEYRDNVKFSRKDSYDFTVKPMGRGEFYGFELDGDHLYVDGNFIVHHNSGKSFTIANLIYTIHKQINSNYKYLVYVPNRQLVDQMYKDFIEYGFEKGFVTRLASGLKGNDKYDDKAHVIISNRQYLQTNSDKLPKIDVLFNDEVHTSADSTTSTFKFIEQLDCDMKFGCSGTLPRSKIEKWNLQGVFGKIVYTENITDLQNRGFISKLKIDLIKIRDSVVGNDRNYLFNMNPIRRFDSENPDQVLFDQAYRDEIDYINENYTDLYTPILNKLGNYNGNMLILFDRIEFGKNMYELAKEMKIRNSEFYYIDGNIDVSEREKIRAEFENSDNNILFAQSTTFSTGISIKRLNNLVLFFSGKSFSKILQSIGRTLRLHKSKEYAQLIDISFNYKYSHKHFLERMQIYKNSYGKNKVDNIINIEI